MENVGQVPFRLKSALAEARASCQRNAQGGLPHTPCGTGNLSGPCRPGERDEHRGNRTDKRDDDDDAFHRAQMRFFTDALHVAPR